ncbi:MAG: NAD(P)/FAD-dependent oxidoreductase [Propionibacteriaceae bacterium]|nr:NAD(P)/FAD-dependent oxidoreductase [Propionibacteriaceae bacterium]
MKKVVIIGGGPAGLTAGYELVKAGGYEVTLLEASEVFGGISRTVETQGNRMDIGGHRFFSKDTRVTDWWSLFVQPQGSLALDQLLLGTQVGLVDGGADPQSEDLVMLERIRVSRIYYRHNFFDYPVSLNWTTIKNMGFLTTMKAGFSYLATIFRSLPEDNLENFYINRFGRVLYSMFFEGYTEKLWGRHPREISAEWGAQRVKGLSIRAVLVDIFTKIFRVKNRKVETSLIEKFVYPKYGPGQLWTAVADEIRSLGGTVVTGACVTDVVRGKSGKITSVVCANGKKYPCDELISSMPVKDLVEAMKDVPSDMAEIAEGLPYRDFQTVGLLVPNDKFLLRNNGKRPTVGDITPDCWIYVQDTSVTLGRLQIFNNWSPYMVGDLENTVWMGLEYFNTEGDEYWAMSDEDFVAFAVEELVRIGVIASADDVLMSHREHVKKAYPAYFDTYENFDQLRGFLDTIDNLWCVGRNGQHRYNNMDHSMVTAFETVGAIVAGESDKSRVWEVNTDQEYHEEK